MAAKKKAAKKKTVKKKKVARKPSLKHKKERLEIPVEVHAKEEDLQGNYCNVALIKHTPREFAFDFLLRFDNYSTLVSRVITSPEHAKEIHDVLGKNITRYEETFGKIKLEKK